MILRAALHYHPSNKVHSTVYHNVANSLWWTNNLNILIFWPWMFLLQYRSQGVHMLYCIFSPWFIFNNYTLGRNPRTKEPNYRRLSCDVRSNLPTARIGIANTALGQATRSDTGVTILHVFILYQGSIPWLTTKAQPYSSRSWGNLVYKVLSHKAIGAPNLIDLPWFVKETQITTVFNTSSEAAKGAENERAQGHNWTTSTIHHERHQPTQNSNLADSSW